MVHAYYYDWFKISSVYYEAPEATQEVVVETKEVPKNYSTTTVRQIVEREMASVDIRLVDVARCESRFRQFDSNGNVLRGEINPQDVGVFQINEHYWLAESKKLGLDIYTLEGNIAMAKVIHARQGIQAWNWSANCHGHR